MTKTRVLGFGTFSELVWHLQSTRSRRLLNEFWCFGVQNEVESLLVLFLLFPTHFYWVENNKNFQGSKKLCIFPCPLSNCFIPGLPAPKLPSMQMINNWDWYIAYMWNPSSWSFLFTFQVTHLKISTQTEHSKMWPAGSSKSASGTRNENAYKRTIRAAFRMPSPARGRKRWRAGS